MERRFAPENDYRSLAMIEPGTPGLSVSVVIPAFERPALLARTLAGLANQQGYPANLISVVVADDGSTADIAGVVKRSGLDATYVRQEHDGYGAGRARNLGAGVTDADVLLFLDADCLPVPDLVARHMTWHHRSQSAVVIGSRRYADTSDLDPGEPGFAARIWQLNGEDTEDWRSVLYRRTNGLAHGTEAFRAFLSGNVSVRRAQFTALGGFSLDFRSWGGEDTELGWRLFQAGLWFIPESRAIIYHQVQEESHPGEWRKEDRAESTATLTSKIPHRFYRPASAGGPFAIPKVSIVVSPAAAAAGPALIDRLGRQRLGDWEAWFPLDPDLDAPERRLRSLPDRAGSDEQRLLRALAGSVGEYVALLSGGAVPHPDLLRRCVGDLDATPRASIVTVGYAGAERGMADARLGAWGMPAFALIRRRELSKVLPHFSSPEAVWSVVLELSRTRFLDEPLITVPPRGTSADETVPAPLPTAHRRRSLFGRFQKRLAGLLPGRNRRKPVVVHVGPKETTAALVEAAPWARIVHGRRGRAVIVTGTLDDRTYQRCLEMDEPRLERLVLGAAAGSGPAGDWADFLRTCLSVGLAGDDDVATIRAWGYSGPVTVTGRFDHTSPQSASALDALREVLR